MMHKTIIHFLQSVVALLSYEAIVPGWKSYRQRPTAEAPQNVSARFQSLVEMTTSSAFWTITLCLFLFLAGEAVSQLSKRPYRFDCGSDSSKVADGTVRLTDADAYAKDRGFGWLSDGARSYKRDELVRSRDAFSIDGLLADRLDFRADLPSGRWWITLWVDAGIEDSSTVAMEFEGVVANPKWQAFAPPSEPRTKLQSAYRVYHGPVNVDGDGLQFSIEGGGDRVRLLGFSLTPDPIVATAVQRTMLERVRDLGQFNVTGSLDSLQAQFSAMVLDNPQDAFSAYWLEQLQLLRAAEEHFEKRGWEKFRMRSGLSIFDRFHHAVMILDGLLNYPQAEANPLNERALLLRGRLLYWLARERGGPNEEAGGRRDLAALYQRHPNNKLLRMYSGERVDLPDPCDDLATIPGAPQWSLAQRELLCRMRQIAHWWVIEQQADNGEFGGKLGDDVELLRWWTPLIVAGDTIALSGWRKLADEVFKNDKVFKGYSRRPIDVEHSSEFIADTAPAMVLYSDDPSYLDRLQFSADYFANLWTGKSDHGRRFFRSSWFSSTEVDERPPRNRDLEYNSRAVKAVRYLAWKSRDSQVVQALHEWSLAWVNAAMRTDKGKPKGIIPASVRFPDEAINGDEPNWYQANMFWPYFEWQSHAGAMMLDQLLFTYTLTGDESLLQPLFAALDLVEAHEGQSDQQSPGTEAWAASKLRHDNGFWSVAGQWRLQTGEKRYDNLLNKYGTPYLRYRLTGNQNYLVDGMAQPLSEVRFNTPLKTTEVLHTDRVYVHGYEHLKAMLTSDGIQESLSPYYAVTWEGADDNFTALVTNSGPVSVAVEAFSYSRDFQDIAMRLWQLSPGKYDVTIEAGGQASQTRQIEVYSRGQRLPVGLPPQQRLTVQINQH